jgi:hypothetical protein
MSATAFNKGLAFMYVVALLFVIAAAVVGASYYSSPVTERPHIDGHQALKPGGVWGHGFGIVGSVMILLLFLYSARKKHVFGLRIGKLRLWLDVHIFFGIVGPLLITLHTAMKFHGIVSISYFSMLAVMFSGIFGRYVYMQIPRDTSGHALTLESMRSREAEIKERLEKLGIPVDVRKRIDAITKGSHTSGNMLVVLMKAAVHDMVLKSRVRRAKRYMRKRGQAIHPRVVDEVGRLAREQSLLQRRIAFLNTMKNVFHLWHVIHKPFAYVMVIIMFVHITVTVLFGYRWIF